MDRGRGLNLLAAVLCAGAVGIVFADASSSPDSPETGRLVGAAFRDVALGIIGGVVLTFLFSLAMREGLGWRDLTDDGYVVGGVLAVILALATGAPEPSTAAGPAQESNGAVISECATGQEDPVEAADDPSLTRVSQEEVRLTLGPGAPEDVVRQTRIYTDPNRGENVTTLEIGDSDDAHEDALAGFTAAQEEQGATTGQTEISGTTVTEFSFPGGRSTAYARSGCFGVSVVAVEGGATERLGQVLGL